MQPHEYSPARKAAVLLATLALVIAGAPAWRYVDGSLTWSNSRPAPEPSHRVVVHFGSLCCGPDVSALTQVSRLVADQERESGRSLERTWATWGREGERTLCLSLGGLKASEQEIFVAQMRALLQKSWGTRMEENAPCRIGGGPRDA